MFKFIPIGLLFLFISLSSFSWVDTFSSSYHDNSDKINQKNKDGKKEGKWIYYGRDFPKLGYPLDGKVEEGYYANNRKTGDWIKYHKDGKTPMVIGQYQNNRPNGDYTKYYTNGRISEKGNFTNNKFKDSLIRYHFNGKLKYQANYIDGRESGAVRTFHENGKIESEYTSSKGIITGTYKSYSNTGELQKVITFNERGNVVKTENIKPDTSSQKPPMINKPQGEGAPKPNNPIVKYGKFQPNGYNKIYTSNDELWQDGEFKDGVLYNGKVYVYDVDGILLKVKVFKEGIYHSDGQL